MDMSQNDPLGLFANSNNNDDPLGLFSNEAAPAQDEGLLGKVKQAVGWKSGLAFTRPEGMTEDTFSAGVPEVQDEGRKRNVLMENSLMRGQDGLQVAAPEADSLPTVQRLNSALPFERKKEQNRTWLDNNRPFVEDQLSRNFNLAPEDAAVEFERMRAAGVVPDATRTGMREATWGEAMSSGLDKVKPSFDKAMAGLARLQADTNNDFGLMQEADALRTSANERMAAAEGQLGGTAQDSWKRTLSNAPASIAQNLPAVIAAAAFKNPALAGAASDIGLAGMGLSTLGTSYAEGQEAGLGYGNNLSQAALKSVAEVVPERLSLNAMTKMLGNLVGKKAAEQTAITIAKNVGGYLGKELTTEEMTTLAQFGVDKIYSNPDLTMKDLADQMVETAKATLIQAPILGGAGFVTRAGINALRPKDLTEGVEFTTPASQVAADLLNPDRAQYTVAGVPLERLSDVHLERAKNIVDPERAAAIDAEIARRSAGAQPTAEAQTMTEQTAAPINQDALLAGAEQYGTAGQDQGQSAQPGAETGAADAGGSLADTGAADRGAAGGTTSPAAGGSVPGNGQAGVTGAAPGQSNVGVAPGTGLSQTTIPAENIRIGGLTNETSQAAPLNKQPFTIVPAQSLPESVDGTGQRVSRNDAEAAQLVLGLSGATADFVEFGNDATRQFDGVTIGNHVLVSTQTGKLFGVTVAHEVGHVAENTGNEAWSGFEQVVLEEAKVDLRTDEGLLAYARRYAPQIFNDETIGKLTATQALDKLLPDLGSNYDRNYLRKEFAKDVFGNAVMSDGFMGRVARKLARTDMPLLKNIISALTRAINVLRSKGGKFATGNMIKNLERVRDEAAKVMAEQVRVQSKTNAELKLMVKTNPAMAEAAQGELDMRYSPAKNAAVAVGKSAKDAARKDARLGTAISASFKPGDNYGTVGYPANGGNLTRLHERMLEVTRSAEFDRMLASIGLRPFGEQTTIRGMWLGKPEWTQLLRLKQLNGEPATFEQTRAVANLLAWAAQQDAAITSRVVETPEDGAYNIPSLYFGKSNGEAMSADEIDNALQAFSAVASGASATADGKAIKFLFFPNSKSKQSEEDQLVAFGQALANVATSVGLDPNPAHAYTISALDEFNKRTNENEGRGYRGRLEAAWGKAAKGLGPRAIQGGIGGRAVDTVLVPYIAALRAEGFAFDFGIWQQRNSASEQEVTELRAKVEAYEAQKKHGLVPKLRETIDISGLPNVPIEAKIGLKTTSGNADRYLAVLDGLKTKFPNAVESAENWLEMEAHAFGSNDVPVAPRNLINLMQDDGAGILTQIRRLTPGQIKDANSGFDNAAEFFKYYTSGQVPIETTGKLMLWSFLSRGVSPYIQEAMFVDAVRGVEPFIKMAAAGQFGPAQLEQFIAWSDSIAQANGAGAPGNATKHNLNAFGKSFLTGMSERLPNGKTKLQHLHDLMADKKQSGRDIRREFVKMGEGVGIDNKVISFTLLVTGRPDVLVLDRIQMRNLFDDGSFAGYNLYDGTRVTKLVTDAKNDNRQIHDTLKQGDSEDDASFDERVEIATAALARKLGIGFSKIKAERTIEPGTGLASATTGVRGLMLYEFFEDKLQKILPGVYQKLGRPQDATPGRYHWESWVVVSGQEASHGTLDSLLYEVEGKANPFADVTVKQGEYGQKDYGVRYGRDTSGNPYYLYPASTGELYRLNHQAWRDTLKGIDKIKGKIPGFLLSKDADGRPRVAPWYEDSRIDRTKIDDLLEKNGTKETDASYSPARAGSADDAQQGGKPAAGLPPQFGQARRGAVQVRGVHYSQQVRSNLSGAYYGTGMKGEEGARLADPRNADIRSRIYFYVDEGKGVTPESNVGPQAHDVDLNNLYDVKADPIGYRKAAAGDASKMERLIMQGGFDGYYAPGIFGSQGVAILIGNHSVPVRSLGMGYRGGEAQAPVQSKPAQETDADRVEKARVLPMGEMKGSDWKRMIPAVVSGADVSMLEDGRTYYKSDVVGAMRGAEVRYSPKRVTVNGVERPTENSDGKPIHYTEDGIINFWKWYDSKRQNSSAADRGPGENLGGVWSALDKQGRPRVFYHGTGDDVSAFDLDHENRLDQGWLGTGVYLASDRELANGYADIKKGPFKFGNDLNPGKPNVMPLYVALHNPLIVDDRQKQSLRKKARPRIDQWTAEAKAAGYDGVVMRFGDGSEEVVVFDPSAVKSATGNNGQFDSANPDIRYSPARWYFSPLEKAFESAPDKVFGKAQQVKLWLAANKSKLGLKDDEILWTGINDWLDLQGNGKVSKADVLAYLAGNGVQVQEVLKGKQGYNEDNPTLPKDSDLAVVPSDEDEHGDLARRYRYVVVDESADTTKGWGNTEAEAIADTYSGYPDYWDGDDATKYGQYVLPGGENYRELLLTLPGKTTGSPAFEAMRAEALALQTRAYEDGQRDMTAAEAKRFAELRDEMAKIAPQPAEQYRSNHWEEKNILAHIRMNDRTDADGNKVLFIEELQSDYGQEGKKRGFAPSPEEREKYQQQSFAIASQIDNLIANVRQEGRAPTSEEERQVQDMRAQRSEIDTRLASTIPAAPFVTDTKAWVALAAKRIMAYAAANGYAKVAFVNGEQSADRYDLSKQVDSISWRKNGQTGKTVVIETSNGSSELLVNQNAKVVGTRGGRNAMVDAEEKQLDDVIGKEIAEKVMAENEGRLSGDGLKIGGRGMVVFYDRIVPQVVSDVLKKVGGGKMETVDVPRPYDLGEQYIGGKKERIQTKPLSSPQPGFAVTPAMGEALPLFSPARATPTLPAETKVEQAQRKGQDKFNRFGTLKEWAEANGLKLSEQADVYRAEERYHGRVATRLEDFREKTLKPLIEKIHKAGFTMQDVAAFLEAQHTPEANAHIRKLTNDPKATAAGVTDAEAATYLAQANPALARVANEFRQITEQSKRLLLKSGLISQEQADAWSGAYQHYVPLKGGPEEQAARTGQGPGMSVNAKQKRRLGHGKRAEFVIENIIRDHERAIMLSEKNLVGQHLLQAAIELQQLDPDLITIGKPEKRKVYVPGKTTYAIDYNGSTVAAFDSENEARRFLTFMGKSGMTIRQVTGDPHIQMTAAPMLQENEAGVYVQGQLVRVQINDEILARAYKNLGVENLNAVLRGARHLNTWLSKAYTGLNPEFILVNMARDFTGGLINITGNYGGGIATTAIANYPKAMMEILAYSMRGKTSANVQQYRENGGSTGGAYLSSLERVGQDIAAQYNEMVGVQENLANRKAWAASRAAGRKTFKFFTKWIEHMNAASENAMRLAVFMAVRDKTGSLAEAASAAKNSTVNFDRVGEAGRMAGALYLFANPNIQGTAGLWKSLIRGKHNGQAWALVGGLIALAVLAAMQFDDDEWKKIPEFEKDRNLLIRFGENRIKIPVPYGYGFFFGLGNVYRNIQAGDSVGKVSAHLASALFEHFSPFGNPVQSWTTMLPTAIKIPVQHAANVNDFNRQIVPENQFNKNKPDFLKMNRSTKGTAFDTISRGLNEMSGGTAGTSGLIDISPETTKTLWRTMTGGTGAFWTDLFGYGRLVYEGAERDMHEVPVVRKFAAEPRITDVRANYFEEVDKAKKVLDQFNAARKEHDQAGMDKLKAEKEMLALARAADASRAAIKAMRDKQDKILNDTEKPLAYRRAEVKQLERKEAELYQRILKAYGH